VIFVGVAKRSDTIKSRRKQLFDTTHKYAILQWTYFLYQLTHSNTYYSICLFDLQNNISMEILVLTMWNRVSVM